MRRSRSTGGASPRAQIDSNDHPTLEQNRAFDQRIKYFAAFWILLFLAVVGRLFFIQIVSHEEFLAQAHESHLREWDIPAPRGTIFDRNNKALAMNVPEKAVFIDPVFFRKLYLEEPEIASATGDPAQLAEKKAADKKRASQDSKRLAALLKIDHKALEYKLHNNPKRYLIIKHGLSQEFADEVKALKLRWVGLQDEQKRTYPHNTMAAQTLGFVRTDGKGLAGIEAAQNTLLAGSPGKMSLEVDERGRPISGLRVVDIPCQPGQNITLTLDITLQQIAEAELAKGIKAASASGGSVIVMDPNNGEILALATQPTFDPNNFGKYSDHLWVNPAVVGAYEPGSTFKPVIACAVLEEGIPFSRTRLVCEGEKTIGRRTIHCAMHEGKRAHGTVDLTTIITESCNVGVAMLSEKVGKARFADYVQLFGFGEKTGIELGGESPGLLPSVSSWSDIRAANIAFGQGLSVNSVQLLRAYCVIANGGLLVKPHLLLSQENSPPERVLSEETCRQMRAILTKVVEEGTGANAGIEGYLVAGKTGTAQKPVPGQGYDSGKYIASFVGFVPADNPKLAILVLIDEPTEYHFGSVVAAPVFREVARQALLHLNIPPTQLEMVSQTSTGASQPVSYTSP